MKEFTLKDAEVIPRTYGSMKMLVGGKRVPTSKADLRILEIRPGESTSTHNHIKSESVFYVLSGDLEMTVDNTVILLKASDGIVVEPGEVHVLRNVGAEQAQVLETMSPPFSSKDIEYR
jgi:putative monooxygenase